MNIKEYISSGIVESYVLGLASPEERLEFEQTCAQYPEVLEARITFEEQLEQEARQQALQPDPGLKQKILRETGSNRGGTPLKPAPVRKINRWKYVAAASIILLAGSVYLNLNLSERNVRLSSSKKILEQSNRELSDELASIQKDIDLLTNQPQVVMASLKGTPESPRSYTTVYWDTASHDVYLLVNNLPKPADSLQYQLWALADGQPIDLGFISDEYFVKQDKLLLKARNTRQAQAFAITLEKKNRPDPSKPGGSIYVVGHL